MMWNSLYYHQVPVSPHMLGVCWPLHVSPSSCTRTMLSSHLSLLCKATPWAETTPFCKWNASDPQGVVRNAAPILLHSHKEPQKCCCLCLNQCRLLWLKGHRMSSAKRGRVTTPHLFAKQALAFPVSLQQDIFHKALFRAQPPCSGSLEASATQIQRRNCKAEEPRNPFGDQQAAGTSGHAPVSSPSPSCKHLSCTRADVQSLDLTIPQLLGAALQPQREVRGAQVSQDIPSTTQR